MAQNRTPGAVTLQRQVAVTSARDAIDGGQVGELWAVWSSDSFRSRRCRSAVIMGEATRHLASAHRAGRGSVTERDVRHCRAATRAVAAETRPWAVTWYHVLHL